MAGVSLSPRSPSKCLVFDLGAGSGRAMLATYDGTCLNVNEVYRFGTAAVERADGPHWDLNWLKDRIEEGIRRTHQAVGRVDSIGVDSWGLDYALVDEKGDTLIDPFHYRHPRSQRGYEGFHLDPQNLFKMNGIQNLPVNTIFQLFDEAKHAPERVNGAAGLLMMADLLSHHLTGQCRSEYTLARTSGLLDVVTGEWNLGLCQTLGLPGRLFQKLIRPGEVYGYVRSEIGEKIGWTGVPVIAVAGHDTASAVAALPLRPGEAFVIAGSWSLVGVETVQPRIDDQVWRTGFGNEGGVGGRTTLIRSLPGLHLIQELRALWRSRTGLDVAYPEISARAAAAARENEAVDVNLSDPVFFNPVDIVDEIMRYSRQRDVTVTEDLGVVALAIYAGLAREIRSAVGVLERELGYELNSIMIGGGGARDATLCGMIERSVRQTVVVAPSEASALGNALLQLIGLGVLPSLDAGRELVERSPGLLSL